VKSLSSELVITVTDAFAGGVLSKLLAIRTAVARDTLLDRVGAGVLSIEQAADEDEAVAIIYKYLTVAQQGAALENLQIIADIAADRLDATPIRSGDFGHWAELVASFLPEERYFLAVLGQCAQIGDKLHPDNGFQAEQHATDSFWETISSRNDSPFQNYEACQSVGLGLTRTGCVKPIVLLSNGYRFAPTSKLKTLLKIAQIHSTVDAGV
jgi:hypothetical protein